MSHFYEKIVYSILIALGCAYITQAQTTTENYIKTIECLKADCTEKKETVVYFDGLGREKQALQVAASPTGKTIIVPYEYDGFGRQAKDFLPFPLPSATNEISPGVTGDGFYSTLTGDSSPFSEKTFENSPLNRVLSQAAPGNSWKKESGNEIEFQYATNSDNEVLNFNVANPTTNPTLISNGTYTNGTLYKTITIDENKQPIVEFKDKEGRVILKRINIASTTQLNSSGNHDTYYVYDIYGNLAFVLPPKLIEVGISTDNLAELGYQYFYDDKNRLVEKQLPGKGREFMVYDNQDRLTLQQDANQRASANRGWTFFKYDKLGRIVYSGFFKNTATRVAMQTALNNKRTPNNEERTTVGYANNGTVIFYSNAQFPNGGLTIQSVNYYDHYQNLAVTPSSIDGQNVIGADDIKAKGLAVASHTNVLGTTTWNKAYTYYDKEYLRPIASASTNYLGGYANTASVLDFRGKVKNTVTKHKPTSSGTEITINEGFDYYDNELLKYQTHQINSGSVEYIVQNSYNEINQLISKKVGNDNSSSSLQTVDYKYNIRGWMTDINNVDITETGTYKDLFSFKLNYNTITELNWDPAKYKPLYNGNIAETIWKTNDNQIRSYSYEYDGLNRLLSGTYIKKNQIVNAFNENIKGYDKNGNILGIIRSGEQDTSNQPIWIDDTNYSYPTNSNKLLAVTDDTSYATKGFIDGNTNGDDYVYDLNGNLTKDLNKGITEIKYNFLNLPTEVLWNASKKINYTYDASGVKLRKIVTDGATVITTDYLGGFQYKDNILLFFPTAEGYVNATNGTTFNYVYNYTDHLGNVRLSYQKESNGTLKVLEESNYYPFGLKHNRCGNGQPCLAEGDMSLDVVGSKNYDYKYNGKELQDEFNINLYDYGARNYDPAIGRWMNIDPLAEKSRRFSPYTYALNNPVFFIDPDGMAAEDWKQDKLGNYVYDASLTKENASTKLSEGETYLGASASISVDNKSTGEIGSLNLNEDGTASMTTGNTTQSIENTTMDFDFASGHLVMAGNHGEGTYSEINFNWAVFGGFGLAFGNVTDSYGKSSWYFSVNGNVGYGGGGGYEHGSITPTALGGRFELLDFKGEGSQYNLSIPGSPISVGSGGSYDSSVFGTGLNKMNYNNFGQNKNGYTTQNFGGAIGPGINIGAMFSNGKTWLIK